MKYGYTVWCFCIFVGCSANGNSNNTETNNSSNNTNNLTNLNNANNQNNANNVNNVNNANNLNNANNVNNTNNTNQTNNTNNTNNTNQTNNTNNGCVDADADGWFVDCLDFTGVNGPDCADDDPNNWTSCQTCVDADSDSAFVGCDAYQSIAGPDCADDDPNNDVSCATCVDVDSDSYFVDCDRYNTILGPDCADDDPNNWTSCLTCLDGDNDTWFAGCDQYLTINGVDCNDGNANQNPGQTEVVNNNIDDDCDPNTSDLFCEYTDIPANPPEVGYRMGLTAAHNEWRWRVGTTPLNWNNTLAVSADSWAINCQFQHDPDRAPDAGFNSIGENIYLVGGGLTPTKVLNAVSAWASERTLYDYGTAIDLQNYMIFGHYTQIVWDDTTDVGCGARFCAGLNATMVVCRYGPAGNFIGQTPYDFGADACYDLDNDDTWQGDDADDTDRTVQ